MDEFELIEAIRERIEGAAAGAPHAAPSRSGVVIGSGDDAAVTEPRGATATSVDALVEGIHFRREIAPLRSVGHKALAVALSDLAAMGAEAGEAYVQLGIPGEVEEAGCLELAEGLAAEAARHGVTVAGGDVTRAPILILALTVVGHRASADEFVPRSGAGPGDVLVVTGELGGAAAGLLLLDRPELAQALPPAVADALRRRQLEPEPRLRAGDALAHAGATAMIDVSDGLGGDARHVAVASGVRLAIELERLPLQDGVGVLAEAAGLDPLDLAIGGGEDYELLASLPPGQLEASIKALSGFGLSLSQIGRVEEGEGVSLRGADGRERQPSGFDHLRVT